MYGGPFACYEVNAGGPEILAFEPGIPTPGNDVNGVATGACVAEEDGGGGGEGHEEGGDEYGDFHAGMGLVEDEVQKR